jgi:hypothetical protein
MPLKAIKVGYRLFDGAYDYQNEKEAGQGIRRAIDEGIVTREEIFVTTKLWNNYHRREHALSMAKAQNEAWGLGYIDLYLIHFPIALKYIEPEKLRYPVSFRTHFLSCSSHLGVRADNEMLGMVDGSGTQSHRNRQGSCSGNLESIGGGGGCRHR